MKRFLLLFFFVFTTSSYANSAPIYSTFLFPKEFLSTYEPLNDPTYPYYKNLPNLSKRVIRNEIYSTNLSRVMGLLNYDSRSDLNPKIIGPVEGYDRSLFEGWNYIDVYVSYSGDAQLGLITVPTPQEISIGHKNGVPVLGTVLFPPDYFNGQVQWEKDFLKKDEEGKYLAIHKLENLAKTFHFDGWFFYFQTGGLDRSEVDGIVHIIKELKNRGLNIVWDEGLTRDGNIAYQNELNRGNKIFFKNATSMYTFNEWFDWNLFISRMTAKERSNDVYMSINWWDNNDTAFSRVQDLISFNSLSQDNSRHLSLGMWAIEFPVKGGNDLTVDQTHQLFAGKWWVSDLYKDIPANTKATFGEFLTPRTAITELPITSNFNLGKGLNYYRNGIILGGHSKNWGNLAEQDYLVASVVHKEKLTADYDFLNVFNGGTSYAINSNGFYGEFPVYYSWIENKDTVIFDIVYQSNESILAYLKYTDGSKSIMHLNKTQGWSSQGFSVNVNGRTISEIGINVNPRSQINLGRIAMR